MKTGPDDSSTYTEKWKRGATKEVGLRIEKEKEKGAGGVGLVVDLCNPILKLL